MKYFILFFAIILSPLIAAEKPNIVFYIADDHSRSLNSVFGDDRILTPMMESLAKDGMRFNNVFITSPACGPSRSSLLSGLTPIRTGAEENHMETKPEVFTMVKRLQDLGYEVASFGKVAHKHSDTIACGFDYAVKNRKDLAKNVAAYLKKRKSTQPLCLIVGDRRPHTTWTKKNIYDVSKISLPSTLIDTPKTRTQFARYLSDVTAMDAEMSAVDKLAKQYFGTDNFLFIYSSDHGGQLPFAKWNLYDAGIHVPMFIRWPGKISPGTQTDAMVSWMDVFPTFIDLAGGKPSEDIDGKSFAKVLTGKEKTHREVIFTTHTGDETYNVYPIRSVRTAKFKYLRNIHPDSYHSNHSDILRLDGSGSYWDSWDKAAKTDPKAKAIIKKYYIRPAVELYDITNDPLEQNNLANSPEYRDQLQKLSNMLDQWMKKNDDTVRMRFKPYPITGHVPYYVAPHPGSAASKFKKEYGERKSAPTSNTVK